MNSIIENTESCFSSQSKKPKQGKAIRSDQDIESLKKQSVILGCMDISREGKQVVENGEVCGK